MNPTQWDQSDVAALRKFIADHPRFETKLKTYIPKRQGKGLEEYALSSASRDGAETIIEAIFKTMTADVPRAEATPFVDID
jgi:hypothetical protein